MNCKEFRSFLILSQDQALNPKQLPGMEDHARDCRSCKLLLDKQELLEHFITAEQAREPNPFVSTRILQRLTGMQAPVTAGKSLVIRPVLVTLGLLAALAAGFLIGTAGSVQEPDLTEENRIETLRTGLFVSDFADEDINLIE